MDPLQTVEKKSLFNEFRSAINIVGMMPIATVVLIIVFSLFQPRFATLANLNNVIFQAGILALVSFGQLFPMLSGGIDFSVGAQIALASIIGALLMVQYGIFIGIVGALLGTALVGLCIGIVVAKFKTSALIVSLGMYWMVMGITHLLCGGAQVYGLPESFEAFGISRIMGVPIAAVWAILAFIVCYFLLNKTVFGKYLYALGANERAAHLSGIPVDLIRILSYVICSLLAAFSGLILTAALASGQPSLGADLMMQNFIVVFIAGTRWGGGEGNIVTVFCAVIFVAALANGLNILNVSSYTQQVITGLVLVAALASDSIKRNGLPDFMLRR